MHHFSVYVVPHSVLCVRRTFSSAGISLVAPCCVPEDLEQWRSLWHHERHHILDMVYCKSTAGQMPHSCTKKVGKGGFQSQGRKCMLQLFPKGAPKGMEMKTNLQCLAPLPP